MNEAVFKYEHLTHEITVNANSGGNYNFTLSVPSGYVIHSILYATGSGDLIKLSLSSGQDYSYVGTTRNIVGLGYYNMHTASLTRTLTLDVVYIKSNCMQAV